MGPPPRLLVLFPGALGDFVCFVPTLLALRARHGPGVRLVARPAHAALLDLPDLDVVSIDRREVADLFADGAPLAPATRALFGGRPATYSWTGAGHPAFARRLAAATGSTPRVVPFRDLRPGEHAADAFARSAGVAPAPVPAALFREDARALPPLPPPDAPLLVVHPGSGSPRKNWTGFAELVRAWRAAGGSALALRGPVEAETGAGAVPDAPALSGLALPAVVPVLRRASVFVGNDAGVTHLAAALGTPTVALFGDTDPAAWGPRGPRVRIAHGPAPCPRCSPGVLCTHRIPVARVRDCAVALLR